MSRISRDLYRRYGNFRLWWHVRVALRDWESPIWWAMPLNDEDRAWAQRTAEELIGPPDQPAE